ncbi:hypothetical protein K2X30_15750 [bacterium]|jgi:hypothetical protein|nr:hypothetical protein [bacterium]
MRPRHFLLCFGFLTALSSCAHRYDFPVNRLDSAEVRGKPGPSRLEALGLHGANQLHGDASNLSLDPSVINDFLGFAMGLGEKFDLGLRFHVTGPLLLRARYQIAGEPEIRAQQGNFAATIGASVGYSLSSARDINTNQSQTASYFAFDGSLTLGYRVWDHFQVLLGGFYASSSYSLPQATGSLSQPGWLWGVRWDQEALFITFEVARSFATGTGLASGGYFPGLAIGLSL